MSVFLALLVGSTTSSDERLERLTLEQRRWLEEEVVYVIGEAERDAFLSMETADVRDRFIEAFWKRRDPNPTTLRNEFRDEHYRRLSYANDVLGRETPRPGFRTDRGRYYILLGEPREIQRYERHELQPIELWFYDGEPRLGLPPFFYLLFFKPHTTGEFELYHPAFDGPAALVAGSPSQSASHEYALEILRDVSVELARASLSFDPSERAYDARAISSAGTDVLLGRIEASPERLARTDYLEAWRRYGDRVSAEYSFNFVPNRSTFAVLTGPESTRFIHYSIEIDPENFNLETDERHERYTTVVDLDLEIRTADGDPVVVKNRAIPFELSADQFEQARTSPVAIQGAFPVVPGDHRVSLIARNRVLTQFTVAERDVYVPEETPGLSDVVLGFRSELASPGREGEVRPFQVGEHVVHPAAGGVFALGETAHILVQVRSETSRPRLRFELVDAGGGLVLERELRDPSSVVVESLPLSDVSAPGNYELRAFLMDASGRTLAERSAPLVVSPRTVVVRAGFLSREGFNGAAPGLLALERGEQLVALGRVDQGVAELGRAVAADNPALPMARWKLAAVMVNASEAERALELLSPLETDYPDQFEVVAGLGFAYYQLMEFEKCRHHLGRASGLKAPYPALLNALADCHERTGSPGLALETFERSLEIDPEQPLVEERIARLRSQR